MTMKKTLMIDMDDVITDGTFRAQIEKYIGEKIDFAKTGYFLQNALGDKKERFFRSEPLNMYQDAPLKEECYDTILKLNEIYDSYIVSAYHIPDAPYQEGNHLKFKIEYLQKKLPFLSSSQIIFCNQKNIIPFDIRIDDSIKNLANANTKLLFSAYHNLEIKEEELKKQNIIRVNNWQEVIEVLLKEPQQK